MREQCNDLTAKKIGSRLRQIREGRGLTQKEVADEDRGKDTCKIGK